ncbi:MAG TPA: hypothetical protein VL027_11345 [Spongiibacteraceae bacterium]|nr:hypothetical protein [Spongiibacteraceae bacterium]HUH38526.1 hypothetical protein [Spongiibacteraceae bacterium]
MPLDDIATLVKYCSVETGLKILESQSLRFSAPALFGDPFAPDHHSQPGFDAETLLDELVRTVVAMVFGAEAPTGKSNKLIVAICRWRDEERFQSEEEAEPVLRQLLRPIAEQRHQQAEQFVNEWRSYASEVRMACFSERHQLLPCWQRFADEHRGLALRFACGDDTALGRPHRVHYSASPPHITHLREQVEIMLGRQAPLSTADFRDKLLTKGRYQQAEAELRCLVREPGAGGDDPELWYADRSFPAPELNAVFLGVRMTPRDRVLIARLVAEKYPRARLYQAECASGRYELEFRQVSTAAVVGAANLA